MDTLPTLTVNMMTGCRPIKCVFMPSVFQYLSHKLWKPMLNL